MDRVLKFIHLAIREYLHAHVGTHNLMRTRAPTRTHMYVCMFDQRDLMHMNIWI